MNKEEFMNIQTRIKDVLDNMFNNFANKNPEDYILFLINGEYNDVVATNRSLGLSPYTIDYRIDDYNDQNRLTFMCDFLNKYYSFSSEKDIEFNTYQLNIEMMIYSHVWESKPFLKNLYRLTSLLNLEEYKWEVSDTLFYSRANFLNDHVISKFSNINTEITTIIEKGYDRVLRNAFAHSDYSIEQKTNEIVYFNDRQKEINKRYLRLSFDDWHIRFIYSSLFSYWFSKIKMDRRMSLTKNFNRTEFFIKVSDSDGNLRNVKINTLDNCQNFRYC